MKLIDHDNAAKTTGTGPLDTHTIACKGETPAYTTPEQRVWRSMSEGVPLEANTVVEGFAGYTDLIRAVVELLQQEDGRRRLDEAGDVYAFGITFAQVSC